MLPEFPQAYDAIQKVWNHLLFQAAGFSDPFVSQIAVRVQREGHRAFLGESETQYKPHRVSYQWKPEAGKGIPTEEYFGMPVRLGREIAMQQAKGAFEALSKASPHVAKLSKSDEPVTFDLLLTKMEDAEIDFDDSGKPKWPHWFLSEEAMAEFRAQMSDGGLTPEQNEKLGQLVARKRKEFDERENRRRLVD